MTYTKTAQLDKVQNKGQRAVIVAVLAKAQGPLTAEQITDRAVKTGQYNGKGVKGHVNDWAQKKAGGDLGSIKYHLRALITEGRVKELNEVAPKKEQAKAKKEATPEVAAQPEATEEVVAA